MSIARRFAAVCGVSICVLSADVTIAQTSASASTGESCVVKAHGKLSSVGFEGLQDRWTETFSNNGCDFNVRAKVLCDDTGQRTIETHYGKTIYSDGYSYYTCDITQSFVKGNGQYYNGVKWVDYST